MVIPELRDGRIVLIRGTRDTTGRQPKYELPAGAIEPKETPEQAALRELAEETGYVAAQIIYVGTFIESPGISASRCSTYIGRGLDQLEQSLDPAEDWIPHAMTLDEVDNLSLTGEIVDGSTLAALYQYRLYHSAS
jgi:ADP-ribose pyrophosphatase